MSPQNNQKSCTLCHAYLFPEDDVVYCPECGAPHHRECYNSIGKCALEELHGTENQYDKIKEQEPEPSPQESEKEEKQQRYETPFGEFSPIDFLGGVKPETLIDDGVTAKQAANFVFSNTMRYIPKFAKLNSQSKISWNFMAFLFPSGWFLSRKMYKNGIILGIFEILALILTIPFQNTLINLGMTQMVSYADMAAKISENMAQISPLVVGVAFIGSIISLAVSLVSALLGDWIYKKHTVKTVREIEASSEGKASDYRKKGGVNFLLFLLGYMAIRYIPVIISTLI